MSPPITVVSSKAPHAVLEILAQEFEVATGRTVELVAFGGVDVVTRVRGGEEFDVVVLASDAIDGLLSAGRLLPDTKVDLARSGAAIAVRAGTEPPLIDSEESLKRSVLKAQRIGHSTGPSGVALAGLFARWGITEAMRERILIAPPGTSVGTLVARGQVDLGFQQLSELLHVPGVHVVGPLPAAVQILTTFSAAVGASSSSPEGARALVSFMASPQASNAKRRMGMEPV
jgi:molybdate transport system substrate-binding protein